ncbi:hypothetical protein BO94DRAFT_554837 [Aspergillus sclerotioniger CBS 115572]|uniref:GST N-terminal domain-containing protein n=1 Tax=Aspergillus sclerotioniger CBS 115572 TaxID=1450535 RepID=A0A317X6Q6_9EURO|nr:hypothetical protein BO94DRAFT_554837 [Aspergillus sclerotioniger CBS 115572]PWY93332.1 hypothetical protein BO94DRAFT_554837 [Aspergillus sclerotioniger CBS 115572]
MQEISFSSDKLGGIDHCGKSRLIAHVCRDPTKQGKLRSQESQVYRHADADGHFRRKDSAFRSFILGDPNAEFPAEKDRYVLYLNSRCPWAHRTNLVRSLKGLEDIQLVVLDPELGPEGWFFSADLNYKGRYAVPMLWDKKRATIVKNEKLRDVNRPGGGFCPAHLRSKIDAMNEWVYHKINNGVYKTGFATAQEAYNENHLAQPAHQPYLFGENITEADIRLFTTICRFDVAYYLIFRCNLRMIRHGKRSIQTIIPAGPSPDILPLEA